MYNINKVSSPTMLSQDEETI